MTLTEKELQAYFTGKKKHAAYNKTVEIYDNLRTHANGEKPHNCSTITAPAKAPRYSTTG